MHTYTHTGHYEEAQLPYYDAVPMDPSFEDMKKAVVIDKRRPTIPNQWSQSEVGRFSLNTDMYIALYICIPLVWAWQLALNLDLGSKYGTKEHASPGWPAPRTFFFYVRLN